MTANPFDDYAPTETTSPPKIRMAAGVLVERALAERLPMADGKPKPDWFARVAADAVNRIRQIAGADPDPDTAAELLWLIDGRLDEILAAVKTAKAAIAEHLIANVAEHGAIRLGDAAYRANTDRKRRHVDRDATAQWLISQGGAQAITEVYRLDEQVTRWGALDYWIDQAAEAAYADEEALDAAAVAEVLAKIDELRRALTDTLVEWVDGPHQGLKLEAVPTSKAVWASKLAHLERDTTRKPKKQPEPTPEAVESSPQAE